MNSSPKHYRRSSSGVPSALKAKNRERPLSSSSIRVDVTTGRRSSRRKVEKGEDGDGTAPGNKLEGKTAAASLLQAKSGSLRNLVLNEMNERSIALAKINMIESKVTNNDFMSSINKKWRSTLSEVEKENAEPDEIEVQRVLRERRLARQALVPSKDAQESVTPRELQRRLSQVAAPAEEINKALEERHKSVKERMKDDGPAREPTLNVDLTTLQDLDVDNYKSIIKVFNHHANAEGEMDVDTFIEVFSPRFGLPEHELRIWFSQADPTNRGKLRANEFLSFVVSRYHALVNRQTVIGQFMFKPPVELIGSQRRTRNLFNRILHVPELDLYATSSIDRAVSLYSAKRIAKLNNLPGAEFGHKVPCLFREEMLRMGTVTTEKDIIYGKNPWEKEQALFGNKIYGTDMVYLGDRTLAVSSIDKSITMYKLTSRRISVLNDDLAWDAKECGWFTVSDVPRCMSIGNSSLFAGSSTLVGCAGGSVRLYDMENHCEVARHEFHKDSITKVAFYEGVGLCASDESGVISMYHRANWTPLWRGLAHSGVIYDHDYSEKYRFIATAGSDRVVHLWNPYSQMRAVPFASLHHPKEPVMKVIINEDNNQIITCTFKKVVRIFDCRNMRCFQVLRDESITVQGDEFADAIYDSNNQRLVTVGAKLLTWDLDLASGQEQSTQDAYVVPHKTEVVGVHFSEEFKQIISISEDGDVRLWDPDSGKEIFYFVAKHDGVITATTLDHAGRRLYTSGHYGKVKLWNFNNGELLATFTAQLGSEIVKVSAMRPGLLASVLFCGWCTEGGGLPPDDAPAHAPKKIFRTLEPEKERTEVNLIMAVDDKVFMTATNGAMCMFDGRTGKIESQVYAPKDAHSDDGRTLTPSAAAYLKEFLLLAIMFDDGSVGLYWKNGLLSFNEGELTSPVKSSGHLAADKREDNLMGVYENGCVILWSLMPLVSTKSLVRMRFFISPNHSFTSLCWIEYLDVFAVGNSTGEVLLYTIGGTLAAKLRQQDWPNFDTIRRQSGCVDGGDDSSIGSFSDEEDTNYGKKFRQASRAVMGIVRMEMNAFSRMKPEDKIRKSLTKRASIVSNKMRARAKSLSPDPNNPIPFADESSPIFAEPSLEDYGMQEVYQAPPPTPGFLEGTSGGKTIRVFDESFLRDEDRRQRGKLDAALRAKGYLSDDD